MRALWRSHSSNLQKRGIGEMGATAEINVGAENYVLTCGAK